MSTPFADAVSVKEYVWMVPVANRGLMMTKDVFLVEGKRGVETVFGDFASTTSEKILRAPKAFSVGENIAQLTVGNELTDAGLKYVADYGVERSADALKKWTAAHTPHDFNHAGPEGVPSLTQR